MQLWLFFPQFCFVLKTHWNNAEAAGKQNKTKIVVLLGGYWETRMTILIFRQRYHSVGNESQFLAASIAVAMEEDVNAISNRNCP